MMKRSLFVLALTSLCILSSSAAAEWEEYKSDEFGFRMLVPAQTKGAAKDFGGGWGGLYFQVGDDLHVYGAAKLGAEATPEEIRAFGVGATGIPADAWEAGEKGSDWHGFKWFESYSSEAGGKVMLGYLGVGPKGNYFIYVVTTPSFYAAHEADFDKFEDSIYVH